MFTAEHSSNRKIDPSNVCYKLHISAVKTLGQPDDRKGTLGTMESHKVHKKCTTAKQDKAIHTTLRGWDTRPQTAIDIMALGHG